MKRFTLAACAGLVTLAMASPSLAANLPPPRAPYKAPLYSPVPVFSWTGFYVGIVGGYAWGDSDWSSSTATGSTNPDGGLIGGTLGYNLQTGNWVWGIEGDIEYSWIKGTDTGGTGLCSGTGCETKNTWFGTIRGRIGYAFDRWLPYITGGVALGDVKMTANTGLSESDTAVGWTVGAGVEYAFLTPWTFKLEYLYTDLGDSTCSAATCGVDTSVGFTTSTVRAGFNYRF